jgi:Na+/pantothenate symporter
MTEAMNDDNESKVGKKLSDFTTRKVVILVLVMLFTSPIFSVSTYLEEPNTYNYGLEMMKIHWFGRIQTLNSRT